MADQAIPSPNEPFINPDGNKITRTWYRVLAALTKNSGLLAQPIRLGANSFFVGGDLNSGSTLEVATISAGTVLGNPSTSAAAAQPVSLDSSLSMAGGKLGVAPIAAFSLMGNAGSVAAEPAGIAIGAGLTILATTPPQLTASGSGSAGSGDLAGAQVLSWWRQ